MALTNHAWDLTDSTGWTFDSAKIEFLAGGLHLKTGQTYATAISPAFLTTIGGGGATDWGRIYNFVSTYVEEIHADLGEYRHQILVSFDGGTTYFGPGANRLIEDANTGWVLEQLRDWREWPAASEVTSVKVLIAITRSAASSADGILATLRLNEGTTANVGIDGEPDENDALPTFGLSTGNVYRGANPDWPLEMTIEAPVHDARYESGHIATYAHGSFFREVYQCRFGGRVDDSTASVTELTDLLAFLEDHVAVSFEWTPPGAPAARSFVSSHPRVEVVAQLGATRTVANVFATWTEVNA